MDSDYLVYFYVSRRIVVCAQSDVILGRFHSYTTEAWAATEDDECAVKALYKGEPFDACVLQVSALCPSFLVHFIFYFCDLVQLGRKVRLSINDLVLTYHACLGRSFEN